MAQVVINTRSGPRAEATHLAFAAAGFEVVDAPLRRYAPKIGRQDFLELLSQTPDAALAFLSPMAVIQVLGLLGDDRERLRSRKLLCLAKGTAEGLGKLGITLEFVGRAGTGAAFAEEVRAHFGDDAPEVLVLQSAIGRDDFLLGLQAKGIRASSQAIYENMADSEGEARLRETLASTPDAIILAYAPSALEGLSRIESSSLRLASIGTTTSASARGIGIKPFCEASQPGDASLIESLRSALSESEQAQ